MRKLSTGDDSTLGNWKKLVKVTFGPGPAIDYLNKKIEESKEGEGEEVVMDEKQALFMLGTIHFGKGGAG